MNHWILAFRPETYERVKRHGTIGVLEMHRRRFSELQPHDKFVTYVSQRCLLDGHGEVTGEPYVDQTPIFGEDQTYPRRCAVRFLETGVARDARDVLWFMPTFHEMDMKTQPTNYLFCYGGFMKITAADYRWALEVLDGSRVVQVAERAL